MNVAIYPFYSSLGDLNRSAGNNAGLFSGWLFRGSLAINVARLLFVQWLDESHEEKSEYEGRCSHGDFRYH